MVHQAPKDRESLVPEKKVAAAGLSAAGVTLLVFAAQMFGFTVPESVAAAVVTVVAFVAGYFKKG